MEYVTVIQLSYIYLCRYLGKLKGTVKNKAHPEGSIAETHIVNESLWFCDTYLNAPGTELYRNGRYYDGEVNTDRDLSVFSHEIRPIGSPISATLTKKELDIVRWYVLNNCDELHPYLL